VALAATAYVVHRFLVAPHGTAPLAGAYLNDVVLAIGFAGLVDAIVRVLLFRPATRWELLAATAAGAFVWELGPVVWPAVRPDAVADRWDALAYLVGMAAYLVARHSRRPARYVG
jgi:hypothetical protein